MAACHWFSEQIAHMSMMMRNSIQNTPTRQPALRQRVLRLPALRLLTLWGLAMVLDARTAAVQAAEPAPAWHTSLETAQKLARDSGKPIFAVFRCER